MTQNEYIEKIRINIKDSSCELSDDDLLTALQNALAGLSRDVPLIKSVTFSTQENNRFQLPQDWEEGYSYIQCIEVVQDDSSSYLEENNYRIIILEGIHYLEVSDFDLLNYEAVKIYYSIPYNISEGNNNVNGSLGTALLWLSCSFAMFALVQKHCYSVQSDLNTDLKLDKKSEVFLEISDRYKTKYNDLIERIIFGAVSSKAFISTKCHSSDVYGDSKIFH